MAVSIKVWYLLTLLLQCDAISLSLCMQYTFNVEELLELEFLELLVLQDFFPSRLGSYNSVDIDVWIGYYSINLDSTFLLVSYVYLASYFD